jgi:flagellar protein FlgJ
VAEVTTTEFVGGVAQKRIAKFRAYDSYEDSFKDYSRMISESPRYAKVREQTGSAHAFASGLQKAGYATDPEYAAKLSRAIHTTQQLRRVQV